MSTFKPNVSLKDLPQDALTFKDDLFYTLVEKLTSSDVSRILKSQRINSINTFLLCKNILASILLPTSAFDTIRRDVCVKLDQNNNNYHVVQIGIVGQFEYLTELFRKKHVEQAKPALKRRLLSTTVSMPNPLSLLSTSTSTYASTATVRSTAVNPPSTNASVNPPAFCPTIDHRPNIVSSINKWATSQEKDIGSNNVKLVEGTDYTVQFSSLADIAVVVCQCTTRLSLSKSTDNTFCLSNLYKHWKNSKKCNVYTSKLTCAPPLSTPSLSSSSNDSVTNDDDDENHDPSFSSSTRPSTRRSSKRVASSSLSTINTTAVKRRR